MKYWIRKFNNEYIFSTNAKIEKRLPLTKFFNFRKNFLNFFSNKLIPWNIVEQLRNYIVRNRYMYRVYDDQYILQKAKEIAHKLFYDTD